MKDLVGNYERNWDFFGPHVLIIKHPHPKHINTYINLSHNHTWPTPAPTPAPMPHYPGLYPHPNSTPHHIPLYLPNYNTHPNIISQVNFHWIGHPPGFFLALLFLFFFLLFFFTPPPKKNDWPQKKRKNIGPLKDKKKLRPQPKKTFKFTWSPCIYYNLVWYNSRICALIYIYIFFFRNPPPKKFKILSLLVSVLMSTSVQRFSVFRTWDFSAVSRRAQRER